jgi:hypothetical protein
MIMQQDSCMDTIYRNKKYTTVNNVYSGGAESNI